MIPTRSKRERRDRDSGLVFCWRLPVGNTGTMFMAVLVVGSIAALLSYAIQVHITGPSRMPERRGSFVMLDQGSPESRALELMAQEAGPFPARSRPSEDPVVKQQLNTALVGWMPAGTAYEAEWRDVPVSEAATAGIPADLTFPPLPVVAPDAKPPVARFANLKAISLVSGVTIAPRAAAPSGIVEGTRFMVSYESNGLVDRVMTFDLKDEAGSEAAAGWLMASRIDGGNPSGGWLSVEVVP